MVSSLCPRMILGWSKYPKNLRILRQGAELCPSQHDPGIILGWSKYPRNPKLLRQRRGDKFSLSQDDPAMVEESQESQDTQTGGELCPSQDDPGMVEVSWESQDTQTGGVSCVHPGMILGWSEYLGNPMIRERGSCVHLSMILE